MELGKVWLQYTVPVEKFRPEGTVAPKYGTSYGIGQSLIAVHGPCGKIPARRYCSSQVRHFLWNWAKSGCSTRSLWKNAGQKVLQLPNTALFVELGKVWLQYTVLVEKCMPEGTAVRKYCTSVAQNIHFCAET